MPWGRMVLTALLAGSLLAMLVIINMWSTLGETFKTELRLARNVGEINRIDEVLTMSSRMFAATGDERWRARYSGHVDALDSLLTETLDLMPDPKARALVASTGTANSALVAMEMRAFMLVDAGRRDDAQALLYSRDYIRNKIAYAEGMNRAMHRLAGFAEHMRQSERLTLFQALIGIGLIGLAFVLVLLRMRQAQALEARRKAQVETMRAVAATSMDIVNNFLNSMSYMRFKAESGRRFEPADLHLFDRAIEDAARKMALVAASEAMETRDLGGIDVIDIPEEALTRAA